MTDFVLNSQPLPRLAWTMGDVAGIGPEIIANAWFDPTVHECCRPLVVGHPDVLRRALDLTAAGRNTGIEILRDAQSVPLNAEEIPCWNAGLQEVAEVPPGLNDPRAGRGAYDYLSAATHAALAGQIDGLVTAPLSKAALHLAGLDYPGHTEILAELCKVPDFAMMLYLPRVPTQRLVLPDATPHSLGVVHVTLHTSIKSVPTLLTIEAIREKIQLIDQFMTDVTGRKPRIGVCALNPHAGEEGLFGDEESRLIAPAVQAESVGGSNVTGPLPADTLLLRAINGAFDGVVAMYHDQGHIALKLIAFGRAVNVTLGLPVVRTSPSHGTAFDIAWQGKSDPAGMIEAIRVAAALVVKQRQVGTLGDTPGDTGGTLAVPG